MTKLPLTAAEAEYLPDFLTPSESEDLFTWIDSNCNDDFTNELRMEDGSVHHLDYEKVMFVEPELVSDELWDQSHGARIAWPDSIRWVKDKVEEAFGCEFDVGVCLRYPNGNAGIDYHADFQSFGSVDVIPSLSLGESREFLLRRKLDHLEEVRVNLAHGSLIVMGKGCQEEYEHALPVDADKTGTRINITFRQFDWPNGDSRVAGSPDDESY